MATINVQVPPD